MQTFLPYPDFLESMLTLDRLRLGNQVYREGKTLLTGSWPNHPASKMWRGHEYALASYCLAGVDAMQVRAWHKPETVGRWRHFFTEYQATLNDTGNPEWVGMPEFHAAHRSNLLRKDPDWYSQFGWTEPHDLEYVWPK
jgi:hypothetical protein